MIRILRIRIRHTGLKVAKKLPSDTKWEYFSKGINLPREVLNVSARKAPEGLYIPDLDEHFQIPSISLKSPNRLSKTIAAASPLHVAGPAEVTAAEAVK